MQIKTHNEISFHTHQIGKILNSLWYQSIGDNVKKYPAVSLPRVYPGETRAGALGHANQDGQSSAAVRVSPKQETWNQAHQ